MSLELVCSFIESLSSTVDSLDISHKTKHFACRWDQQDESEERMEESFPHFVSSIKSIQCQISNGSIVLKMRRSFTTKEVMTRKVSVNMQRLLWALGYISIGGGLWDDGLHPDQRLRVEGLYFVNHAFQTNLPPVRSLQSLSYEAMEKNDNPADHDLLECYSDGNQTFSKLSGLEFVKDYRSLGDFYNPFGEASSQSAFQFVGAKKEIVMSYFFTTCLALIKEKVTIEHSNAAHGYHDAVLFHSVNLASVDILVEDLLREALTDMSERSQNIKRYCRFCSYFWGIVFDNAIEDGSKRKLVDEIYVKVEEMKGKYSNKCKSENKHDCRDCLEMEAAHQAAMAFILNSVCRFTNYHMHDN